MTVTVIHVFCFFPTRNQGPWDCFLLIVVGFATMGLAALMTYWEIHLITYGTVPLGSARVFADTSTVLQYNITVSNFTSYDSFVFSTQSRGVTEIRFTGCTLYNKSINTEDTLESVRTDIFGQRLAEGSNITIQIETVSGVYYEDCSTKLVVFDNREYGNEFVKNGMKKHPYEELCISKPTLYLFTARKWSYFYFAIMASEKIAYTFHGDVYTYRGLVRCSIPNATNSCSIGQKWFANESTVCIIATAKNSEETVPYSDIEYGIRKRIVPLWKKIMQSFVPILFLGFCLILTIPFALALIYIKPNIFETKPCHIIGVLCLLLFLIIVPLYFYHEITLFVEAYKL